MTGRDTIAAIATAAGPAGVGIVRLSGPDCLVIATALLGRPPTPRHAHYLHFHDADGAAIDDGLLLYFPAPHSYTGEAALELQGHGSPILLAQLLRRCLQLGARTARPGEFTERAFLEGRLDLAQAEAVADLISAGSDAAAKAARRSLDGEFSRRVDAVVEGLTGLRVWMEAALDFPEEEVDFLAAPELGRRLLAVTAALATLRSDAERGKRLVDGLHVVIAGAPNAGKSSLLNALAGEDRAIVTAIPGTTRDLLREQVRLDGVELTLVDTAGLRDTVEPVEREGIRRARAELAKADLVLVVLDDSVAPAVRELPPGDARLWLHNKADLSGHPPEAQVH
ncbi:MAG: tRNA uridine-5-carboxymethylaminomethyl(34) synthesis GTPase MnmE, partial [Arenimonas sp.]|nr:tRNA uridine-5-carboxymethylaminomethyl(34) synthesis GTPase MnmE [Arenimonas sp.]